MSKSLSRRQFLSRSSAALAVAGAGISCPALGWASEEKETKPGHRILGRTGLEVTQITFGGLQIGTAALLNAALDKGINLIHTSPGYQRGKTIEIYGEVMKTRRDETFVALKQSPFGGIDDALKKLNTDHVDILMPGIDGADKIADERIPEAFEKLKKEGKIRYTGFATHSHVPETVAKAIEVGWYDMMMPVYNVKNSDVMDPLLEKAKKEQNMGMMAMKVLRGLEKNNITPETVKDCYAKALGNKNMDTLLIGMGSFDDLEVNIEACFKKYAAAEQSERFDEVIRYARANGCSACGNCSVCPNGVAVCDIFRFESYARCGEHDLARTSYAELRPEQRADRCQGCRKCCEVCPGSFDIPERLQKAHATLTAFA